jgi:thiamine-phosphate pyrophosphorylase
MSTRQRQRPRQWLIVDQLPNEAVWRAMRRLLRGDGLLLLPPLNPRDRLRIQRVARRRHLLVVIERPRTSARIHNQHELTQAMLRREQVIFVSPLYQTASHPDWKPLPRMRAAALARLTGRRSIALGGMNSKRYARIAPLGFIGWAGISAFRT